MGANRDHENGRPETNRHETNRHETNHHETNHHENHRRTDDHANQLALQAYYARDEERDRLDRDRGRVGFARTVEVVGRTLPPAPAVVADIGGGPGRYTDLLVEAGYSVVHRDIVPHHGDQVRRRRPHRVDGAGEPAVTPRWATPGRSTSTTTATTPPSCSVRCTTSSTNTSGCRRCWRRRASSGRAATCTPLPVTRWVGRLHGMLVRRTHELFPQILDEIDAMERHGWMRPLFDGSFTGYSHRPDQLRHEVAAAGLQLESFVNLEGAAAWLSDVDARMDDPDERRFLLDMLRAVEDVPELLGTGPHLLAVARPA